MSTVTLLEGINSVLGAVAQHPVSSPDSNHPIAVEARAVITRIKRETLEDGWWFNSETDVMLTPDTVGNIIVPSSSLKIRVRDYTGIVRRGTRLYDTIEHTYVFEEGLYCDLVQNLDFDELPPEAATYIIAKARYTHFLDKDGEQVKLRELEKEFNRAYASLQKEDNRQKRVSILQNPTVANLAQRAAGGRSTAQRINFVR